MLNKEGVQAEICYSGNEALDIMQKRIDESKPLFRLIILDYSMPEKDGP